MPFERPSDWEVFVWATQTSLFQQNQQGGRYRFNTEQSARTDRLLGLHEKHPLFSTPKLWHKYKLPCTRGGTRMVSLSLQNFPCLCRAGDRPHVQRDFAHVGREGQLFRGDGPMPWGRTRAVGTLLNQHRQAEHQPHPQPAMKQDWLSTQQGKLYYRPSGSVQGLSCSLRTSPRHAAPALAAATRGDSARPQEGESPVACEASQGATRAALHINWCHSPRAFCNSRFPI